MPCRRPGADARRVEAQPEAAHRTVRAALRGRAHHERHPRGVSAAQVPRCLPPPLPCSPLPAPLCASLAARYGCAATAAPSLKPKPRALLLSHVSSRLVRHLHAAHFTCMRPLAPFVWLQNAVLSAAAHLLALLIQGSRQILVFLNLGAPCRGSGGLQLAVHMLFGGSRHCSQARARKRVRVSETCTDQVYTPCPKTSVKCTLPAKRPLL